MKKLLGIMVLGLLLSGNAFGVSLKELQELQNKNKPWYKKIEVPGVNYFKKRKDCKDYADRADSVYLGKQRYKTCMED
jgi:hypothetical protein